MIANAVVVIVHIGVIVVVGVVVVNVGVVVNVALDVGSVEDFYVYFCFIRGRLSFTAAASSSSSLRRRRRRRRRVTPGPVSFRGSIFSFPPSFENMSPDLPTERQRLKTWYI